MNKTIKNALIAAIGVVVIAVTLAVFFLWDFRRTDPYCAAIGFVIGAETAFFTGLIVLTLLPPAPNRTLLSSGTVCTLSLYLCVSFVIYVLLGIMTLSMAALLIIELAVLAATIILVLIFALSHIAVNNSDSSLLANRRLMQLCEKRVFDLLARHKGEPCEDLLSKVYEKLKYCDKIGNCPEDEKIVGFIMRIEDMLNEDVQDIDSPARELLALMAQRSASVSDMKRGGF